MHILVLLLASFQAFAAVDTVIGTIDSNARSVAFRPATGDTEIYFLYSPNNGTNAAIRNMTSGQSFRMVLKDPHDMGDIQVIHFHLVHLPFGNIDVEEPNPSDAQSLPELSLNDPRLSKRALVYRHLLKDDSWRFKFLSKGGSRDFVRTMRRFVLADTLYGLYPDYPRTPKEAARDDFFDTATEIWESGTGDDTLKLIQTMLYESLDNPTEHTADEAPAVAAHSRATLNICDSLIRTLQVTALHELDASRLQLRLENTIGRMMHVYRPKVH